MSSRACPNGALDERRSDVIDAKNGEEGAAFATGAAQPGEEAWSGDERLEQLHRVLLSMLKDFAALCERNDLRWFVAFGTAIGALRDKGFIPWDDDVDICMPREDLDRLVNIVQNDASGRYGIMNSQVNGKYPLATTRLTLNGTEFRDAALQTVEFESCIFLDLFPLDNVPDDEKLYRKQAWRAWLANKLSIARSVGDPYIAGGGLRAFVLRTGTKAMRGVLRLPGLRSIDLNAISLREQTRYNGEPTRRIGFLCDTDRLGHTYDRDDLFPVRLASFEDMLVPIAFRAEKLLSAFYGDYMTPPPSDQRQEHYPDVLDFGEYAEV